MFYFVLMFPHNKHPHLYMKHMVSPFRTKKKKKTNCTYFVVNALKLFYFYGGGTPDKHCKESLPSQDKESRIDPSVYSVVDLILSHFLPSRLEFQRNNNNKKKTAKWNSAASGLFENNCMYVCTIVLLFIFVLNCISVFKKKNQSVKFLALKL